MKLPNELSEEETRKQFFRRAEQNTVWGLFVEGQLVSVAELNAKAFDLGQVGGVLHIELFPQARATPPTVMRQLIKDAKDLHKIAKLIIFTGEHNMAARKVLPRVRSVLSMPATSHFFLERDALLPIPFYVMVRSSSCIDFIHLC